MIQVAVRDRHPAGTRGRAAAAARAYSKQPGAVSLSSVPAGCRAVFSFAARARAGTDPSSGVVA
jgi:hypothetical protein